MLDEKKLHLKATARIIFKKSYENILSGIKKVVPLQNFRALKSAVAH